MTTVTLRPATVDDGDFAFALHREVGRVVEATWGPWDDRQQRAFHDEWFDPGRLLMVVVDGDDAGVLDAHVLGAWVYLARLELLPRVQRRGIGTQLLKQLVAQARLTGASAVELDVLERNVAARRLYERLGWRVVGGHSPKARMRLDVGPDAPVAEVSPP